MSDRPYPKLQHEAEVERILDARVQVRLGGDAAYRNAENADEQHEREAEIEHEELLRLQREREDFFEDYR